MVMDREFFPTSYFLTDEISAGGRMRIGIRFLGAGKNLERFEPQKRGESLAWTEEGGIERVLSTP